MFAIKSSLLIVAITVNRQINLPITKNISLKIRYSTGFVFFALLYALAEKGMSTIVCAKPPRILTDNIWENVLTSNFNNHTIASNNDPILISMSLLNLSESLAIDHVMKIMTKEDNEIIKPVDK